MKELSLEYQSNGAATLQWYTDMPGGTLAARKVPAVTLASTSSTRKTITIPLDGIEATLYYPEITPAAATQLRLFGGVVWLRPIGVYIDGSQGEVWKTAPLAVGV
jgi:hypothetical protein